MNVLKVTGKYLDQPILINKFTKTVPAILAAGGALYCAKDIYNTPKDRRKKETARMIPTMALTVASALAAPKITNKIFKDSDEIPRTLKEIISDNKGAIGKFLSENKVSKDMEDLLEKAKTKILKHSEVKKLYKGIGENEEGKKLLAELIPDPENIDSKEIFSEIGRLSVFGLIPVLGGIAGGVIGDKLTTKDWKSKIPDKIKEGSYQYLANIFLCNIGAGGALAILEKLHIKSKSARALGMIAGIIATGVVGGSALANLIGEKVINPLLGQKHKDEKLFDERKPEPLDISLHADDVATVAVMSGLKWIEPALPIMYSISGYRAGIGYRNGAKAEHQNNSQSETKLQTQA